jgi:predicted ATP-grasp superfamily ATP-dependent carboligase
MSQKILTKQEVSSLINQHSEVYEHLYERYRNLSTLATKEQLERIGFGLNTDKKLTALLNSSNAFVVRELATDTFLKLFNAKQKKVGDHE